MNNENQVPQDEVEYEAGEPRAILAPIVATNPVLFFLLKYWKIILGVVLVAIILLQNNHIDKQDLQLQVAAEKVLTAEERLNTCSTTLANLSDRIEAVAKQSEGIKDQVDGLQPAIDRININTQRTAAEILKGKTPVTCQEVEAYILQPHNAFDWGLQR